MSYDISIKNKKTKETIVFPVKHTIAGGTYAVGGTDEAWLNITYNYAKFFYNTFGDKGIRSLYGKDIAKTIPRIEKAIAALGNEKPVEDYWADTAGNAKAALINLKHLAELALLYFPDVEMVWDGD